MKYYLFILFFMRYNYFVKLHFKVILMTKEQLAEAIKVFPIPTLCIDSTKNIVGYNEIFILFFKLDKITFELQKFPDYLYEFIMHSLQSLDQKPDKQQHTFISNPEFPYTKIACLSQKIHNNQESFYIIIFLSETLDTIKLLNINEDNSLGVLFDELESIIYNEVKSRLISEKKYQHLFHGSHDGIFILSTSKDYNPFSIIEANYVAAKMIGIDNSTSMNFLDFIPKKYKESIKNQLFWLTVERNFLIVAELENQITKKTIPVEISAQIFDTNNQQNIYLSIRNISERMELEKERDYNRSLLQQKNKMASMGEMISIIAHQWRQPLNVLSLAISNLYDMYCAKSLTEEEFAEHIKHIDSEIAFMDQTINDFQQFFSPSKYRSYFFIKDIIKSACGLIEPLFALKGNTTEIVIKENIVASQKFYGYPNELKQAILIILQNAHDAIIEQYNKTKNSNGKIDIYINYSDTHIKIYIEDNGGGIKEDALPLIFKPYFTTKDKNGNGIGLPTVKMIIEESFRGEVTAHNTEHGACFSIVLPFPSAPQDKE